MSSSLGTYQFLVLHILNRLDQPLRLIDITRFVYGLTEYKDIKVCKTMLVGLLKTLIERGLVETIGAKTKSSKRSRRYAITDLGRTFFEINELANYTLIQKIKPKHPSSPTVNVFISVPEKERKEELSKFYKKLENEKGTESHVV